MNERRMGFFGHLMRRTESSLAKTLAIGRLKGLEGQSPWQTKMLALLKKVGLGEPAECGKAPQDKVEWRKVVKKTLELQEEKDGNWARADEFRRRRREAQTCPFCQQSVEAAALKSHVGRMHKKEIERQGLQKE